mmetsp:Transcript_13219/g.39379  ORF Transcript_13219/g.39379 Transcript_13219/m.39379 type:complete len:308 (-) Transcript_13219:770-1693(-)
MAEPISRKSTTASSAAARASSGFEFSMCTCAVMHRMDPKMPLLAWSSRASLMPMSADFWALISASDAARDGAPPPAWAPSDTAMATASWLTRYRAEASSDDSPSSLKMARARSADLSACLWSSFLDNASASSRSAVASPNCCPSSPSIACALETEATASSGCCISRLIWPIVMRADDSPRTSPTFWKCARISLAACNADEWSFFCMKASTTLSMASVFSPVWPPHSRKPATASSPDCSAESSCPVRKWIPAMALSIRASMCWLPVSWERVMARWAASKASESWSVVMYAETSKSNAAPSPALSARAL